tara:strand:- start:233 stop:397 length:165 start_codon:yes stop_codon:yes gene_type:complete
MESPTIKKYKMDIPKTTTELAEDILKSINDLRMVIKNITLEIKELENTLELIMD